MTGATLSILRRKLVEAADHAHLALKTSGADRERKTKLMLDDIRTIVRVAEMKIDEDVNID